MKKWPVPALWLVLVAFAVTGCRTTPLVSDIAQTSVPRELDKVTLPAYRVEPPDILLIEAIRDIPSPTRVLEPGDQLLLRVSGTLPIDPRDDEAAKEFKRVNGVYLIESDGTVNLGPEYGRVRVAGIPLNQASKVLEGHLRELLRAPKVAASLAFQQGEQKVAGEHLVRPDGTVSLGVYGSLHVAGRTIDEVRQLVEAHLSQYFASPKVSVDVGAYNSKVYYVVTDGAGFGEQVYRFPATGNETVLDALANINGIPAVGDKHRVWVARPMPAIMGASGQQQILPVDWKGVVEGAVTATNYQILPGDRVYVRAQCLISIDGFIGKVLSPLERILGFTLLGNGTVRAVDGQNGGIGGGGF